MIVIPTLTGSPVPSSFAAQEEAAGRPLINTRIGWHTYTRDLSDGSVIATSETAGGPKDSPLQPDTVSYWEPQELPASWRLSLGSIQSVDYVGIASHSLQGCSVLVEISRDGVIFQQFSDVHAPSDATPIMFLDRQQEASHIRITLSSGSPTLQTMPRIGVIYVGQVLAMKEPIRGTHAPINLSRETILYRSLSRGGQFLNQAIRRSGLKSTASFEHLDGDWVREHFDPFVESARQYPFFFAWRPSAEPEEIAYAWCPEDIAPKTMGFMGFMSVSFPLRGVG